MHRIAALALFTLTPLLAQLQSTAHPQDSTQNGSGNLIPFGCLSPTVFTDGRAQVLIRGLELPGPGALLMAIEVHCQSVVALTYSTLNITVSPTTATNLSSTFATNLPTPIPVLQATNMTMNWSGTGFDRINLQPVYVHDGSSSLVIEVQKVVNPATAQFATMSTTSNPSRGDLPSMAYSLGGPGSGASTAANAGVFAPPLAVRLVWANVPTIHLLANQNGSGNQYGLGTTMTLTTEGAPGSLFVNFVANSFLPVFANVPPLQGEWRVQGTTIDVGFLSAGGSFSRPITIPAVSAFVGTHLTYQSGTVDIGTGFAQFTNATDHFINP